VSNSQNLNSSGLVQRVEQLNTLMIAVVLVTFLGFVTLLVTVCGLVIAYQHDSAGSYNSLRDEIKRQGDALDKISKNSTQVLPGTVGQSK
jgi:uncharacterized membrane protein